MLFAPDGAHAGFLRVRGSYRTTRQDPHHFVGDTQVDVILGPDPTGPVAQQLANVRVEGTRLRVLAADRP
jgi:hypothetical protein